MAFYKLRTNKRKRVKQFIGHGVASQAGSPRQVFMDMEWWWGSKEELD